MTTFPPRRCGIGDYAEDLLLALVKVDRIDVRVLTYADGEAEETVGEDGFVISRKLGQKPVLKVVLSEMSTFQPDILHLQSSSFLHPLDVNRAVAAQSGVPLVTTVHDTPQSWRLFYTIPSLRDIYRRSARLVVHSSTVSESLSRFHGVSASKIVRMHLGVASDKYSPNASGDEARQRYGLADKRFVLFFGFLRPGKGVEILLQAWKSIEGAFSDLLLVVAGGTPSRTKRYLGNLRNEVDYPAKLALTAKSLGIDRRVKFTGYVPDHLVPGLLASAELIVLPYEGAFAQSGPLHKALASGRPLIASRVPGSEEILEDGTTALLTRAGDRESLADAIERILTDSRLADKLARNARTLAEERLDWTTVARTTFALYNDLRGE